MNPEVNTVIGLLAIILSIMACSISAIALIKCIAAERSTHTVTFAPIDEQLRGGIEDKWATSVDSLSKQQKLYKEDIEENLPEFAEDEESNKVHSF